MKKLFEQITKFAVVGGTAFIIDYFGMIFLTEVLHINYLISSIISFTLSVIYNYVLSVRWVFTVNNQLSRQKQFVIFVLLSVVGLLLTPFSCGCSPIWYTWTTGLPRSSPRLWLWSTTLFPEKYSWNPETDPYSKSRLI